MCFLKPPSYGRLTSSEGRTGSSITLQVRVFLPQERSTGDLAWQAEHQLTVLPELRGRVLVPLQLPFPSEFDFHRHVVLSALGDEGQVQGCGVGFGRYSFTPPSH